MLRQQPRKPLDAEYDIIVIGGGINGVAIARECALAGRRVLLLEKNDFASGTTSRATRIIHGGLRYLEHGELGLVRESLRERERLLRERPHLVRPLKFVFALNEDSRHSAMQLRVGLWLYRQFGRTKRNGYYPSLRDLEAHLDSGKRWALFQYDDAQCEFPERLVAEWLGEAIGAGAHVRNHAEVLDVRTTDGRVDGVHVRDVFSGAEQFIRSDWVVNATGPWADKVYASTGLTAAKRMIGGVRGSHIVLPRFEGIKDAALYTEAADGRPVFLIPWAGQVLVGTTEVPDGNDPDSVMPADNEIAYLLRIVQLLFPKANLTASDIQYAYSGIRPLPHVGPRQAAAVTRKHIIRNHAEDGALGMLSIIGGKLTTAGELARQCVRKIGLRPQEPAEAFVAAGPASGIESTFATWARMVSQTARISEQSARAIACWHGRRALSVAQLSGQDERCRATLCEHTHHVVAEAVDAVRHECAVTLGDILLRRVPVALQPCFEGECARTAGERIGRALGWNQEKTEEMIEDFEVERDRFLVRPSAALGLGRADRHLPLQPLPDERAA